MHAEQHKHSNVRGAARCRAFLRFCGNAVRFSESYHPLEGGVHGTLNDHFEINRVADQHNRGAGRFPRPHVKGYSRAFQDGDRRRLGVRHSGRVLDENLVHARVER